MLSSEGEGVAFIEVGLLMIVTGLAVAVAVGVAGVFILGLSNGGLQPASAVAFILLLAGLCMMGFFLGRRLLPVLRGLH